MSDKKMDLILKKLDTMEALQNSQGEHIQQLIQIVGATNAKLEELTEDVQQVKDELSIVKEDVQQVKDDLSIVKEDVNILKTNQQTILNIQQEQQKILERLSVRSISHEADIAELRRIK
ncbi:hypothetical protein [Cohnella silvisoli]|uniref:Uncharacterized protein n=1 Tax=Cohnella silvisoli TaxID=2873699 RepID=A0ABV1KS02_9BACL|nr:hypothetical protein [Cohnella silvisoli]MCD9021645.1 hypothetical protein [Cohnella silvisoli]